MISGRPRIVLQPHEYLGGRVPLLCKGYVVFYFGQIILFVSPSPLSRFFWREVEVLDIGFFLLLGLGEEKKQFYACLKLPYLYLSFTKTSRYILFSYKINCSCIRIC
jgi:hypothetical protein